MTVNAAFLAALIAIWGLLFYHIVLTYGGYRHFSRTLADEESSVELPFYPMVSVLIPAHNEEAVIGRTVDAMARLIYPKERIEIIVVNDDSKDRTGSILAAKQRQLPQLRVASTVPGNGGAGKAAALNYGLQFCRGEYIVIYDADNTPERRALLYLVGAIMKDHRLGAVVGKFRTRNKKANLLTRFINVETLSFQWLLQAGRCHFWGLTTIPGTNYIIRRSLLDELGGWEEKALTEDTELTIRIYDSGYRIYWLPHSVTWEQEPESLRVWMKQRTRWAQGNMWIVWHYLWRLPGLKNARIVADVVYFVFTYFVFFVAVILSDVIFLLGLLGVATITIKGPFLLIWILAFVLFVAETYLSLSLERGESTPENLGLTCLMYFTYCQLWIVLIFRASFLIAKRAASRGKGVRWYKTERSSG